MVHSADGRSDGWHVFFSYARADDGPDGTGWVSAARDALVREYEAQNPGSPPCRVFLDRDSIRDMDDFRHRILAHLRRCVVFVAFVSPNYAKSHYCRWELESYLEREHALVHGQDGLAQVYLVELPELHAPSSSTSHELPPWLRALTERHRSQLDLRDLVAKEPSGPGTETKAALTRAMGSLAALVSDRLARLSLGESAPGNLPASLPTWVGRAREMSDIARVFSEQPVGLACIVHGLGGLGKTALAVQYGHSFAADYHAGGRWIVSCDGLHSLEEALVALADEPGLGITIPEEHRRSAEHAARHVLLELEQRTRQRATSPAPGKEAHPERHALLILDGVSDQGFLNATALGRVLDRPWLHTIFTTTLDVSGMDGSQNVHTVPIDPLSHFESVELLHRMHPPLERAAPDERQAVEQIASMLDGFTLALEAAGGYLAIYADHTTAREYLQALEADSLQALEESAHIANARLRHQHKQLRLVLRPIWERLDTEACAALHFASLMSPDYVVDHWLLELLKMESPGPKTALLVDPGIRALKHIVSLRLLRPFAQTPTGARMYRMHRLISEQIRRFIDDSRPGIDAWAKLLSAISFRFRDFVDESRSNIWAALPLGENAIALLAQAPETLSVVETLCEVTDMLIEEEVFVTAARFSALAQQIANASTRLPTARTDRDRADALRVQGYLRFARKYGDDLRHGLAYLEESERVCRLWLAAGGAHDTNWSERLARSIELVGEILLELDPYNRARAVALLEESVSLRLLELSRHPDKIRVRRTLSIARNMLGTALTASIDPTARGRAVEILSQSVEDCRIVIREGKSTEGSWRDLSIALERLAKSFFARNGVHAFDTIRGHYEEALKIRLAIEEASPMSRRNVRDVSVAHENLGTTYLYKAWSPVKEDDDLTRAIEYLEWSIERRTKLFESAPSSVMAIHDLGAAMFFTGKARATQWRRDQAHRQLAINAFFNAIQLERLRARFEETAVSTFDLMCALHGLFVHLLASFGGEIESTLDRLGRELVAVNRIRESKGWNVPPYDDFVEFMRQLANVTPPEGDSPRESGILDRDDPLITTGWPR